MGTLHNSIQKYLATEIEKGVKQSFPESNLNLEDIYHNIGLAPQFEMGHFTFPCFFLAKALKLNPAQIAQKISDNIVNKEKIEQISSQGPYINFFIKGIVLGEEYVHSIIKGHYFDCQITKCPEKIMVEYSQPNTHKILHVGHMRNLCLGNAIVRIMRYTGQKVSAVTYPGDMGTHVAKCLWFYKYHNKTPLPETEKGQWLGRLYTEATLKLEDDLGTPSEEKNREQLTHILKDLHQCKGEFYKLWQETRAWSIELMKEAYQWADVSFDRWFWESEVDVPSINYAKDLYAKGLLVKDQGAIGMDLSQDKLGFCLLIKSDGTGLYATKDVELAKLKFEEFGISRSLYVVDNRQSYHFKQVFKVLEKLGYEHASKCYHLQYEMVELPDGAMSSRKGNIVPLHDLIQQMEEKIKNTYLNRYLDDPQSGWTKEEVEKTATMIANGAIKYGMIRIDNNRKIIFDIDEWTKLDGETGPYLQYVYARIHSLHLKANIDLHSEHIDWSQLNSSTEMALMLKVGQFNTIVEQAAQGPKTMVLTSFLYELGKLFNSFYVDSPILKVDNDALKVARLSLAYSTGQIIKKGLEILGIPAPEKM